MKGLAMLGALALGLPGVRAQEAATPESAVPAVVVLRDGRSQAGRLAPSEAAGGSIRLEQEGGPREFEPSEVAFVLAKGGELLEYSSADAVLAALPRYVLSRQHAALRAAEEKVLEARVVALMDRWLELADALEYSGGERAKIIRWRELRAKSERRFVDEDSAALAADTENELRAAEALPVDLRARILRANPDLGEADFALWQGLLGRILELDPEHAAAWNAVRAGLPAWLAERSELSGADLLRFQGWLRRYPVRAVELEEQSDGKWTYQERIARNILFFSRNHWQTLESELVAYRGPRVMVVSHVREPAALVHCIVVGEVLVSWLEELFGFGEHERAEVVPLTVWLARDQTEYVGIQYSREGDPRRFVGLPNGSFTEMGEYPLTKLYLPEDGPAAAARPLAHELTHHWLYERCPLLSGLERSEADTKNPRGLGYWAVEGFATFAEELQFDLEGLECRPHPGLPIYFDLVASCSPELLLDWPAVFVMAEADRQEASQRFVKNVRMAQHVDGKYLTTDELTLFYHQAAAVCHYLFEAEEGRHRRALLEYLGACYRGDVEDLDVQAVFGMTPDELGARVRAEASRRLEAALGKRLDED